MQADAAPSGAASEHQKLQSISPSPSRCESIQPDLGADHHDPGGEELDPDGPQPPPVALAPPPRRIAAIQSTARTAHFLGIAPTELRRFEDACLSARPPIWSDPEVARAVVAHLERPRTEACFEALFRSAPGTSMSLEALGKAARELKKHVYTSGPRLDIVEGAAFEFVGLGIGELLMVLAAVGQLSPHPSGSVKFSEIYRRSLHGYDDVFSLYADDKPFGSSSGAAVEALRIAAGVAGLPPAAMAHLASLHDVAFVTVDEKFKRRLLTERPKEHSAWLTLVKERALALCAYLILKLTDAYSTDASVFGRVISISRRDAPSWEAMGPVVERPWAQKGLGSDDDHEPPPPDAVGDSDSDADNYHGGEEAAEGPDELQSMTLGPFCPTPSGCPSKGLVRPSDAGGALPEADIVELHPSLELLPPARRFQFSPCPLILVDRCLRNRLCRENGCQLCKLPLRTPLRRMGPRMPFTRLNTPFGALMLLFYESFAPDELHDSQKAFKRFVFGCLTLVGRRKLRPWLNTIVKAAPTCMGLGLDSIVRHAYQRKGHIVFPSRISDVNHLGCHLPLLTRHLLPQSASVFMIAYIAKWQVGHCPSGDAGRFKACSALLDRAYASLIEHPTDMPYLFYGFSVEPPEERARDENEARAVIALEPASLPDDLVNALEVGEAILDLSAAPGDDNTTSGDDSQATTSSNTTSESTSASWSSHTAAGSDSASSGTARRPRKRGRTAGSARRGRGGGSTTSESTTTSSEPPVAGPGGTQNPKAPQAIRGGPKPLPKRSAKGKAAPIVSRRGRSVPEVRTNVESDYAIHISKLDAFSRRIAKSGAHIYPSLHCSILHVTSFDIWGVPVALSTSTGERGFTPVVALFAGLGGHKKNRVRAAFRRAALRAHLKVFPAHVNVDGVVRVVLVPPAVVRCRDKVRSGPAKRVRISVGRFAARDSPLTCLTAYAAPRVGADAPKLIPPTSAGPGVPPVGLQKGLPRPKKAWGTVEPLKSVFWHTGRGGRLRLGWMISGRAGQPPDGVPCDFMIDELFRKRGQTAGEYYLRVIPCRLIRVAIELLLLSSELEEAQLNAAHCLLTGGTRMLMCGQRSESQVVTSVGLQELGKQYPRPAVGPGAPMFLLRDTDRTPGALPLLLNGTHVYNSDGSPHRTIGNASEGLSDSARRYRVPAVRSDARRLLLNMLPACSSGNRDLVETELPPVSLFQLSEGDIAAWVAVHAAAADAEYSRGLLPLQNRHWCVAIRHETSYLPIGWCAWHSGSLEALYVDSHHRHKQLGRRLLAHAVEACGGSITAPWVTGPSGGLKKMVGFAPFGAQRVPESATMVITSSFGRSGAALPFASAAAASESAGAAFGK